MYCRALDDLRLALRNENLLSAFDYYPGAAPWCHMACKKDGTPLVASSYEMCDFTYVDDECLCLDAGTNDELLEKLPKACKMSSIVISWNSTGSHLKQNACCTWLDVGRNTRGRQLRDLLSYVRWKDPVLQNTCVAHPVGSSATSCRATNTSDHWSTGLVVWNVSYKRALLLQTEFTNRSPRNS